ncbi:MAG: hypothetical protein ACI9TY_000335 [Alphaproteobacteria bacterium]|jgi:hypothetical protein
MQSQDYSSFMNKGITEVHHGKVGFFKFVLKGFPKLFK